MSGSCPIDFPGIGPWLVADPMYFPAVIITVLNAYSGFALVAEGFMLDNSLLTTVGALIGVSGSILSYIMVCGSRLQDKLRGVLTAVRLNQCVAMNRTIGNVLFGGIASETASDYKIEGSVTQITVDDTADALANADSVILVCVSVLSNQGIRLKMAHRWLATEWLSQGLNTLLPKLSQCSEPRERK